MKSLPDHLLEGRHQPLGAHARDGGINIAVFSEHADKIEFCVFDTSGARELRRYPLHGPVDGIFHGFLPGLGVGLVYGLRACGPFAPEHGHRFNSHKLLLDPYAREIVGHFGWRAEHHGYQLGHPDGPSSYDNRDNAIHALKARIAAPLAASSFPAPIAASSPPAAPIAASTPPAAPIGPSSPPAPHIPAADVVLYEVHVKGFSKLHPAIPEAMRGTYQALAHPAAIAHFKALGVTTLSLLPVHYALDEPHLADRHLHNYWGYNTLGFFSLNPRLSSTPDDPTATRHEFREMVDTLHANGLEVVLDVVYNHTPEGNEFGPTLSFRGLDNKNWYRLTADGRSENLTGCGNTLNVAHPRVTQFVLDSLRYWVAEMGVDGFRFDLAPVLGRTRHGFDPTAAFFTALRQDPLLARVHLIAEPWDAGPDGYQVGRFPGRFLEWNDKFRDSVRGYWLHTAVACTNGPDGPHSGHSGHSAPHHAPGAVGRGELARRFAASSDLFHHSQRAPTASINFISVHDGFTLADVVSYSRKHNEANGENNRDGRDGELCANFGVEGYTADPAILSLRNKVRRAMLATLLLAQGTPMLCAGDEIGNSQQGNNNAYCQDNPLGWLKWAAADNDLTAFTRRVLALRHQHKALRHNRWFVPYPPPPGELSLVWYTPGGNQMQVHDWHDSGQRALACRIQPCQMASADEATLMILFNPDACALTFTLPDGPWQLLLDSSADAAGEAAPEASTINHSLLVPAHALVVLQA